MSRSDRVTLAENTKKHLANAHPPKVMSAQEAPSWTGLGTTGMCTPASSTQKRMTNIMICSTKSIERSHSHHPVFANFGVMKEEPSWRKDERWTERMSDGLMSSAGGSSRSRHVQSR